MARIPTVTSDVSALGLRANNSVPNTRASADAFGANVGRAMQSLASGINELGGGVQTYVEKRRSETVANAVAQSDFTREELSIRQNAPANGAGYQQSVMDRYGAWVDEQANGIDDDIARTEYRNRMMAQAPAISSRSATFEFTLDEKYSTTQANASLMALENKVLSDPTMYDAYIEQGLAVIDTRTNIPASTREGMKLTWEQNAAKSRFQGMLERATTAQEIDAIAAELTGVGGSAAEGDAPTDWQSKFLPTDYEQLINNMGSTRKAIITKADTDARAAIDTLDARADGLSLIPKEEIVAVQQLVKQSQNPVTINRMARIMRDQSIIEESRRLPPADVRAQINAANGNPGLAYPGMTPTLSTAINEATGAFDVSASYLGATIQREYGQFLPKPERATGNPTFKPVATHGGVNFDNVRSDVYNAATVAGELFGAPLQVNSGSRTQAHQDQLKANAPNSPRVASNSNHTEGTALDVSTTGMSPADQARLVGSLVDAGFTGIGQYGTHIHADFRTAVPNSFGTRQEGGKTWGGWTYLSPEVTAALTERGFGAGLSAAQIKRNAAVAVSSVDNVDYGQGTQIVDDFGKPTSSAMGPMQFTESTFVNVMQTPGVAQRMGVDLTGMSRAQILELRKDPRVATMAGAALAEQNKKALQSSLGRTVNDAELYMAHFLGSGGAQALIVGMQNQPEQSAATLLPQQAEANKPVFYRNGRPLTVREVYGSITAQFGTAPSQVAFGDNQTRQSVLDNMEKGLKDDPMAYAQESGTFQLSPLDASAGFQQRGQDARAIADYYSIPIADIKPFTEDEANNLVRTMKDGSVDDVLEVMTAIENMGGDAARAALKQLDQKDSVYAYAAGLQFERGNTAAASDIIRGQKRIEENPAIKEQIGATSQDLNDVFTNMTGGALLAADPSQRQAIQDAAMAHYIETVYARTGSPQFSDVAYGASVQAVMGGAQGAPAIDRVNGQPTVLPPGVSGPTMEAALERMTIDDWTRLSDEGLPPRYVTGAIIDPQDLADEGVLRAIGGGKYQVMMADGTYATTGMTAQNGRVAAFIFSPKPEDIERIATRPGARPEPPPNAQIAPDGTAYPTDPWTTSFGTYDDDGRWVQPRTPPQ